MDQRFVGRLYRRIIHKYYVNDIQLGLRQRAKQEAVDYIYAHLKNALLFEDRYALLDFSLGKAAEAASSWGLERTQTLVCEFGVAGGKTLRHIAGQWAAPVHGFDSFQGLPEHWTGTAERAGRFDAKGKMPTVPSNVTLHAGWFDQTVPAFLQKTPGPAALLHLDADLYSSTKTVLDLFRERIRPGSVLVFDEYHNYPNWREHEFKAFQEFIAGTGLAYDYIGFSTLQGQAAVQIRA
ncbi:MAG: class I SAM-dependent methyltransferase [Alphaproteobacteria bacterium]|nr:class I SAM-dependent methyltransferase [Alphaproteobacteria bacterium]